MCGRFTLRRPIQQIAETFDAELPADTPIIIEPRYNVAPSPQVPTIALKKDDKTKRSLALLKWGLMPSWSDGRTKPINARVEGIATNGLFRGAFKSRRCLVPADGFIEWRTEGKKKYPYHFRLASEGLFAFAGLYETHKEFGPSCAIVTTTPNELVQEVHDRMPVILQPSAYAKWLDPNTPTEELLSLLVPFPAEEMEAIAISDYVNNAKHEGPKCLEPEADLFSSTQVTHS